MDEQELLALLWSLLPSRAYLIAAFVFGLLGMAAFYYGRKRTNKRVTWLAVGLMFYPYVIGSDIRLLYGVGIAFCIAIAVSIYYPQEPKT
ncbi:hypothetical protein UNDKW_5807 [Undibacterium sp. KW1]|uniref:hypothetical protein n=1 Tax=Undibacterium sp. KW1 TaxID=2058624 RepID=UPI001331F9D0|nr:hypothetical protein [Undibacterium sp. KW1]BBB64080.1 hypothetical protein UNDKW_5807 [Undibacterium sp. KW1]